MLLTTDKNLRFQENLPNSPLRREWNVRNAAKCGLVAQSNICATLTWMKTYVHARLDPGDRARLDELKQVTGETETALVKKGLRLVHEREIQGRRKRTALEVAGKLVGKYRGPSDLSTNKKYLDDLGR